MVIVRCENILVGDNIFFGVGNLKSYNITSNTRVTVYKDSQHMAS